MRIETIFLPRGRCTLLGGDADATTTLLPRETGPLIKRAGAKIEFTAPCVEALGVQGLADRLNEAQNLPPAVRRGRAQAEARRDGPPRPEAWMDDDKRREGPAVEAC